MAEINEVYYFINPDFFSLFPFPRYLSRKALCIFKSIIYSSFLYSLDSLDNLSMFL